MTGEINSKEYWDQRFAHDWEENNGPEQSRFFVEVALDLMPQWFKSYVKRNRPEVCDWGCAQGDGTDALATLVGRKNTSGLDFSAEAIAEARARYSDLRFEEVDLIADDKQTQIGFDVIFSSNTVEHFREPYEVITCLARYARDFVVLLLPYRELERHPEHFFTFADENILVAPGGELFLVFAKSEVTSGREGTLWLGEQVLLIYAQRSALQRLGLTLEEFEINTLRRNQEIESYQARITALESRHRDLIQSSQQAAADQEQTIAQLRQSVKSAEQNVAEKEQDNAQLQQLLQNAQQALADKEQANAQLQQSLQSAEQALADKEQANAKLQQSLQSAEQALADKEHANAQLQQSLESAKQAVAGKEQAIVELQQLIQASREAVSSKDSRILELESALEARVQSAQDKEMYIAILNSELSLARERVYSLLNSASWRITAPLRSLASWKYLRFLAPAAVPAAHPKALTAEPAVRSAHNWKPFELPYQDFNPYDHVTALKPIAVATTNDDYPDLAGPPEFTAICTVLNESKGIDRFLQSLSAQTLQPSEVIFVDGGSQDGTADRIEHWAQTSGINVRLLVEPGATIAKGRNRAIEQSTHEAVVAIDAGCVLHPDYCRALVGSLTEHPDADLVGGIYLSSQGGRWSKYFIPHWPDCDWDEFLPSSRSLLIRKSVWQKCGGYPEYLTKTGEDTLFDINYRRYSKKWVFSLRAIAHWEGPATESQALALANSYGVGDGESGYGDYRFYKLFKQQLRGKRPSSGSRVESAVYSGYLEGRARRAARNLVDQDIRGLAIILSGVPISDSGGGQRCTQLALEFTQQGYKVVFVNIYPSFEEAQRVYLDIDPARLDLYALADFDAGSVLEAYAPLLGSSLVLVEFPHPDLLPVLEQIRARDSRPRIVYDYIDNWQTSLGWTWYTPETESRVIALSDDLVASAQTLKQQLARREKRGVSLVPNAFNARMFNGDELFQRPADLEDTGRPVVMYVGALWGDWFDWELLFESARALADHEFILIGNASSEIVDKATSVKNIRCLGLKPQRQLPAYLHFADVCIIPFKCDSVTHFVNPLKVYEYLAMRVPVVTTAMPELLGLPGVKACATGTEFVDALKSSNKARLDISEVGAFLGSNDWTARVHKLIAIIEDGDLPVADLEELSGASRPGSAIASWQGVLSIENGDVVSAFPLAHKNHSPHEPELNLARYFMRPGDSFVDVGANVGQTIASVRSVNPDIPLVSFEPNPLLAKALGKAAAKLGKVDVRALALASESGDTALWIPVIDGYLVTPLASFDKGVIYEPNQLAYIRGLSATGDIRLLPVNVRMERGDALALQPTIAKIDVEGYELEVITGLKDTLQRTKPFLIVERSYKSPEVAEYLASLGYRAYRYDGERRLHDISRLASGFAADDWPMNMIFVHNDMVKDVVLRGLDIAG